MFVIALRFGLTFISKPYCKGALYFAQKMHFKGGNVTKCVGGLIHNFLAVVDVVI